MKTKSLLLIVFGLLFSLITSAQPTLNYHIVNPRITRISGFDNFEFDIEVKADVAGTYYWAGQCIFSFDNTTLSTTASQWTVTRATAFNNDNSVGNKMYGIVKTITGTPAVLNIGFTGDINAFPNGPSASDFVEITTSYQTLAKVSGRITASSGVAGMDFNMYSGQQFYISGSSVSANYAEPLSGKYASGNFLDTYVGRIYSNSIWTQIGGSVNNTPYVNWATAVNTSVWDGNALITGGSLSNASALRIHSFTGITPPALTIPVTGQLTVSGNTDVDATNGLIIQSTAAGTGSLITNTASGSGSSSAQRFLSGGAWHIVSSPFSGQSVTNFLSNNTNIDTKGSSRGMMDYDATANSWKSFFTNSTGGNLDPAKGFSMRVGASDATITFVGSLQAGSLSASGLTAAKWNCIGNPYTSSIRITHNTSLTDNFLDVNSANLDPNYGAIYVWNKPDASNGQAGNYTVVSNASPLFTDVQQGQAFMVNMKTGVSSVSFTQAMQNHGNTLALKSSKTVWPTIKLIASIGDLKSSTLIAFNDAMTKGLDPTYDAGLINESSDLIVYTKLVEDNGISFAVQALPERDFGSMIIPIGLDLKIGGDVVFSTENMNLPSDCKPILEDKLTNTFTDLSVNVYKATIVANTNLSNRFFLHTSGGLDTKQLSGKLSAYANRNIEIRVVGDVSKNAIATLYDVHGRVVLGKKLSEGSLNIIPTPNIKTGIYMLSVKDNGKLNGFKIMVRE